MPSIAGPVLLLAFVTLFILSLLVKRASLAVLFISLSFQAYYEIRAGATVSLVDVCILAVVVGRLIRLLLVGSFRLRFSPIHVPFVAYFALTALLFVNSGFTSDAIKMVGRGMSAILLYLIVFNDLADMRQLGLTTRRLLVLALVSSLIQFYIFLRYRDMQEYFGFVRVLSDLGIYPPRIPYVMMAVYPVPRPGAHLDPYGGAYALYLLVTIPLAIAAIVFPRQPRHLLAALVSAAALMVALLMTLSRTGIYALLGSLAVLTYLFGKRFMHRRVAYATALTVVIAALLLAFAPEYHRLRIFSRTEDAVASSIGRFTEYVPRSLALSKGALLLGNGLESLDMSQGGIKPHNGFLADLQVRGVFSLLAGLGMYGAAFYEVRRLQWQGGSKRAKAALFWVAGAASGCFFASFATSPIWESQSTALFTIVMAVLAKLRYIQHECPSPGCPSRGFRTPARAPDAEWLHPPEDAAEPSARVVSEYRPVAG